MTTADVTHRRYVPASHAHYGGALVDGAYALALFGDAATDLLIHHDGDEGLFAGYAEVTLHSPVTAGDVISVVARIEHVGTRSRRISFTAHVLVTAAPERSPSAANVLEAPRLAVSAQGTVVVPSQDET